MVLKQTELANPVLRMFHNFLQKMGPAGKQTRRHGRIVQHSWNHLRAPALRPFGDAHGKLGTGHSIQIETVAGQ